MGKRFHTAIAEMRMSKKIIALIAVCIPTILMGLFRRIIPLLILLTPLLARAETILLHDGRLIQGRILNQSRTHVQIRTATGTLLIDKNDIARIDYDDRAQRILDEKAREKKAQEKAREEAIKKEAAEKEARLKNEEEDRREKDSEAQRLKKEADSKHPERSAIDVALFRIDGRQRTISELVMSEFRNNFQAVGRFVENSKWNPHASGYQFEATMLRSLWTFQAGFAYRTIDADMNVNRIEDNSISIFAESGATRPGFSFFSGRGEQRMVFLSVERSLFRRPSYEIGMRLTAQMQRETIKQKGHDVLFIFDSTPARKEFELADLVQHTTTDRRARLDLRYHRSLLGGRIGFSAGAVSGGASIVLKGDRTTIRTVFSSTDYQVAGYTSYEGQFRGRYEGPAFELEYSRPILPTLEWVVRYDWQRARFRLTSTNGGVTGLSLQSSGLNLNLIPFGLGLPVFFPEGPQYMTVSELFIGVNYRL